MNPLNTLRRRSVFKLAAGAALTSTVSSTFASHHFEVAAVRKVAGLNQLDNFVFESATPGYTTLVMSLNSDPKSGPNGLFLSDALYNIHVASDDKFKMGHTFSFRFDTGAVTIYMSANPNGPVGETGEAIGSGNVGETVALKNGIKVWAGAVKDPFYGNSPGLLAFRMQQAAGKYDRAVWKNSSGTNIFTGRRSSTIVLEVPNEMLGSDAKVFMTTAVSESGSWRQVQYSANPLFSHTMLFNSEALKSQHDASRPTTQDEARNYVSASCARASALAKTQTDPLAYGDSVASMLVPDVLNYKVASKAEYSNRVRNGRKIDDDAMSVMLTLLIGEPTSQAIDNPKLYQASFPYVIPSPL